MRHLISTFAAQVQIPGRWCFATALWSDWTSNMGSVLGLYPPWGICAAQTLVGRGPAGLGCTVILLYVMWRFYKCGLLSYSCHSWDMEFGPLMPSPSLAEREAQSGEVAEKRVLHHLPAVTLDMSCYLPGPLTFLQQNENTGSEGFQEVLLLLWNVVYDSS